MQELKYDDESVLGKIVRSLGPFGFIAVDESRVNLNDLLAPSDAGRIVRVMGDPNTCIRIIPSENPETLGCLAGWISEG